MLAFFFAPIRVHAAVLAAVSGAVFLALCLGARLLPRAPVASTEIEIGTTHSALLLTNGQALPKEVSASKGRTSNRWRLEARGATNEETLRRLDAALEGLRSHVGADQDPNGRASALASQLQEKSRLLESQRALKERALRKVDALDAAAFALKVRRRARERSLSDPSDPVQSLLASLQDVRARLSRALPPEHPSLAAVSREIDHVTAAAASRAELAETARRVALFRAQLHSLQERYSPDHPDVVRKAAEVRALERQLREHRDDYELLATVLERGELSRRESRYWDAEVHALEVETRHWQAEVGRISALERDVGQLAARLLEARRGSQSAGAVRVVSEPRVSVAAEIPPGLVGTAFGFALGVGVGAVFCLHGRGRRVWGIEDLSPGPWQEAVFCAPQFATPRTWAASLLRATVAVVPWALAVSIVS